MKLVCWMIGCIALLSIGCSAEKVSYDKRTATENKKLEADALKKDDLSEKNNPNKAKQDKDKDEKNLIPRATVTSDIEVDIDTIIDMLPKNDSVMEVFPPGVRVESKAEGMGQVGGGYADGLSGAPSNGVEGILSCPTVDLPIYTGSDVAAPASSSLTAKYQQFCAGCHGATAEGDGPYPTLKGISKDKFKSIVRNGKDRMPAYVQSSISDAELDALYDGINTDAKKLSASNVSPYKWGEADFAKARSEGLQAWRKPDKDGIACANCHSPDAIDLAIIGYPDASILRRAYEHLEPGDAAKVVKYVHAQRRHFKISRTCSPLWRPFQPMGVALPGNNSKEQDLSFAKVLDQKIPTLMSGKVSSLDDAKTAFASLQSIDLRTLPIGIKLPRWTEDGFHGEAHRSINDYMPPVGAIPNNKTEMYGLEDKYIQSGSDQDLYALVDQIENTNDGGFAANSPKGASGCFNFGEPGSFVTQMNLKKRESVLVAQHIFRMEVTNPGSYLNKKIPFVNSAKPLNPFLTFGGNYVEPPCYTEQAQKDIFETLPVKLQKEMPKRDIDDGSAYWFHKDLTHPWMTLGQVFEQTFLNSDTSTNNHLQYWSDLNFTQNFYHEPFFYAHRIAKHLQHKEFFKSQLASQQGKKLSRYAIANMNPLLDGETLFQMRVNNAVHPEQGEVFKANRFRGNLIRSFLLLQKELLDSGAGIRAYGDKNCDHGLCLARHYDKIKNFTKDLRRYLGMAEASKIDAKLVADKVFYTDEIDKLADEVYGMAQSR